jgi:hypothetical protein
MKSSALTGVCIHMLASFVGTLPDTGGFAGGRASGTSWLAEMSCVAS